MTNFQNFIAESILFSNSKIEQEALSSFATIQKNGIVQIAENVLDLDHSQLEMGSHFIDDYSKFLIDPAKYREELRDNFYGRDN